MKESEYKWRKVSTSEGKCVLVEVGAIISWCIYSYRIVMLLVPYMWANMTFLPNMWASMTFCPTDYCIYNVSVPLERHSVGLEWTGDTWDCTYWVTRKGRSGQIVGPYWNTRFGTGRFRVLIQPGKGISAIDRFKRDGDEVFCNEDTWSTVVIFCS